MLESLPIVRVVPTAVVPVSAEAIADADFVVGGNANVALVEEGVELLREEETVLDVVATRSEVRLDVRSIEDGAMSEPECEAKAPVLAQWKAGFLEDCQTLHLARKSSFASTIRQWCAEPAVERAFVQYALGGERRFRSLVAIAEQALRD